MDVSLRSLATWLRDSLQHNLGDQMRDNYRFWSYLDDLAIAVPAVMVNHTMHYATAALEKSGYQINCGKLRYMPRSPPKWFQGPLIVAAPEAPRKVPDWTDKWTTDRVVLLGSDQLEPGTTGFQTRPPVWIGSEAFHDKTCRAVMETRSELTDNIDSLLAHAPVRTPSLSVALLLLRLCVRSKVVYTLRSAYSTNILRLAEDLDSHFQAKLHEWIDLPEGSPPSLPTFPRPHLDVGVLALPLFGNSPRLGVSS